MDIAAKRVYDASAGRTRLAVATGQGLAVVGISADVIGEFGLALREPIRDVVAAGAGRLLVATAEGVLVVALAEDEVAATAARAATGAGPTTAVTVADDAAIAADEDGVVRRAPVAAVAGALQPESGGAASGVEWTDVGEADVVRADGRLLAAADGVYRVSTGGIQHVGLDDARDVAATGPFAATGAGLFRLGPGWTRERPGPVDLVSAVRSPSVPRTAHAAMDDELLARTDDGWSTASWPVASPVAGLAYGSATDDDAGGATPPRYAVAADGTILVDAGDGWRTRSIGLRDVTGCAVVE